ncbi:hypothetical protein AVEN_61944-1 [Araneus ventricosus]|uniref:Uncharacterized protein n=1 Tax=Araneus ventricosus TaxID=182803 RepID=A0A4Y2QUD9_ARAVE|nr:hypothetical protein AVEN_61944-1 [Araneus ventricosus]
MTRTTPELAPPSPNFRALPTGGCFVTTYDLACNRPHTRRIFSGIGFRTCYPPVPRSGKIPALGLVGSRFVPLLYHRADVHAKSDVGVQTLSLWCGSEVRRRGAGPGVILAVFENYVVFSK